MTEQIEKMKIKVGFDFTDEEKHLSDVIDRAVAAREFLKIVQKTPIGELSDLCGRLLDVLPAPDGRFSFIWEQMSPEERDEVTGVREDAERLIEDMSDNGE